MNLGRRASWSMYFESGFSMAAGLLLKIGASLVANYYCDSELAVVVPISAFEVTGSLRTPSGSGIRSSVNY
jgi:hypothetical protein